MKIRISDVNIRIWVRVSKLEPRLGMQDTAEKWITHQKLKQFKPHTYGDPVNADSPLPSSFPPSLNFHGDLSLGQGRF